MRGSFVPDVKKDCSASSKGVLCQHTKGEWGNMLSRKKFTFCIGQAPSQFSSQWSDSIYHITRARKNYANYTQTLHLTLYLSDFLRVTKCMVCAANPTQTIHWTIHSVFEHDLNESNGWSEWIVHNERNERNERDGLVTGWWRVGDGVTGVTEVSREQSFIISFRSAPLLKH